MATPLQPVAGPSHTPQPGNAFSQPPQSSDLKRRPEADPDQVRRVKHPRPPLPPPHVLKSLVPDSVAFDELLKVESKLDWTLMRKKAELNDALGRPVKVKRALRVFISNTAHDQAWQKEKDAQAAAAAAGAKDGADVVMGEGGEVKPAGAPPVNPAIDSSVDVNTGKGVPGWNLRIEGRLLDSGNVRLDRTKRKFSTFLKRVVVEFDQREAPTYPEGNIVEWTPQTQHAPTDGFEIMRRGDVNVNCRIILDVAHFPERFKINNPLADLIAMKEGTRSEIMAAVWKLIKLSGAQDKEDSTVVRPVGGMQKLMAPGQDGMAFHEIPQIVARFLSHPDPIIIPYTVQVDQDFKFHEKCFDIPIEMDDPLKSKMADIVRKLEGEEGKEIMALEDKVGELAYFARDVKQKRDFLEAFAANPQAFIQNWLAVQARDLDQMLGYQIGTAAMNGGNVREEDLRRSDLFMLPWVDEAINVHEAGRMEQERRQARAAQMQAQQGQPGQAR